MTNQELNSYIKHYLENDKTHSAIMLTGDWGSGKSYYIQHELIPFLNGNGEDRCITVSLYGLSSLSELSKNIFLELKTKNKPVKKLRSFVEKIMKKHSQEIVAYGKVVGVTLLKGLFNQGGLDLNAPDKVMKELYHSVNLSGKLLIIEDAERSQIRLSDLLGYINNLVETDSVKVLVVANEDAILNYEDCKPDKDEKTQRITIRETTEYLKTKEKTISDTIIFEGDQEAAIRNIIKEFKNEKLTQYATEESVRKISTLLDNYHCRNLRTFTYACQKTADIYDLLKGESTAEQEECIFFSIIKLSCQIKTVGLPEWTGSGQLSLDLSSESYPLYRFCYDYIRWQTFNLASAEKAFAEHKKFKLYDRNSDRHDADIAILSNFYVHAEEDVLNALKNIEHRLDNAEDIPFYTYGQLAIYLVKIHTVLDFDYGECKRKMTENIRGLWNDVDGEILFPFGDDSFSDDERAQYTQFQADIVASLNDKRDNKYSFQYSPDELSSYYKTIATNRANIKNDREFISRFDIDKLIDMFVDCNAEQIHDFRGILFAVYRNAAKNSFIDADVTAMQELQSKLSEAQNTGQFSKDRIVLLQIKYLIDNLKRFEEQIN